MKVKMFFDWIIKELESDINGWLVAHPDITIQHVVQSQTNTVRSEIGAVVVSVWYEGPDRQ